MKLILACLALLIAAPVSAATFNQGDKWIGQLTGTQTLTFSAPYATPCGDGDWSGCSYQAGGNILAVADPATCGGWCGETIATFNIGAYKPNQEVTLDFGKWAGMNIVIHFTGQNPVSFNLPAVSPQPAPVPLPASALLLAAGLASFAGLRRIRRKA